MYKSILNRLFTLGFLFSIGSVFAQNIYTIVGIGTPGYSGDNGPAISSELQGPLGIAIDLSSNIYICDTYNGRIRKVDATTGIITTIAGGGSSLSDGILATTALVQKPIGIDVDSDGNIYFAEAQYNQVRKINTSGIITTIAGIPSTIGGVSGDGGPATLAYLNTPTDVAIDTIGNIYITTTGFSRIRMVNTLGIITTIAGSTGGFSGDGGPAVAAQLANPIGIAVDNNGNIYISDFGNNRIRKIDAGGIITTIAGTGIQGGAGDGGLATAAEIYGPRGIKIDSLGNLYIAEYGLRVRKIDNTGVITKVAGQDTSGYSGDGGLAILATLSLADITVDVFGNVFICDTYNNRIRKVCNGSCVQGVNELNKTQQIFVYPNPTTNILNISSENNTYENSTIEVTNYLGQTILKQVYSSTVDVSKLPSGIYTLKITTSNKQSYYSKFIKE